MSWFVLLNLRMTRDSNCKGKLLCCFFFSFSFLLQYFISKKFFPCIPRDKFFAEPDVVAFVDEEHTLLNSTQTRLSWTLGNVSRHTCLFKHLVHLVIKKNLRVQLCFSEINLYKHFICNLWLRMDLIIWTWESLLKMYYRCRKITLQHGSLLNVFLQ